MNIENPEEETIHVLARLPKRLADIVWEKSKKNNLDFHDMCGRYILIGLEHERQKEKIK